MWWIRVQCLQSERVWICREACQRAGYIRVRKENRGWVISVAVLPAFQCRGLGSWMLREVTAKLVQQKPERFVWAQVALTNLSSRRVFEQAGFVRTGRAQAGKVWYKKEQVT